MNGLGSQDKADDRFVQSVHETAEMDSVSAISLPLGAKPMRMNAGAAPYSAEKEHSQTMLKAAREPRPPEVVRAELEQLFKSHHQVIWRTLRRLGASEEAAADFTQQAFVIIAERYAQVRPGAEKAFLFSTAIRLAKTSRRREWRCQLEEDMEVHRDRLRQEEKATKKRYARQLMDHILGRLDEELVTVFVLFELEGMSSPEISRLLGIPVGTVASRLRRARLGFRDEVAQLEDALVQGASNERS